MVTDPVRISRRRVLGSAALGAAGLVASACNPAANAANSDRSAAVPFHGSHQAGVTTPAQERLVLATYDVTTRDAQALAALLRGWTDAARAFTAGESLGVTPAPGQPPSAASPPADTGEAVGLGPARLTLTIGYGTSLFDDRFGLTGRRPAALIDLPRFPGDSVDATRSGGDLCVQACADDTQVAFHAIRDLTRLALGTAVARDVQLGFGRAASTSRTQRTPRNLLGFRDGTANVVAEDRSAVEHHVWVGPETDQAWMRGGTYLVARRIRTHLEAWDRSPLASQEQAFGRHKASGAPLGAAGEHDPVDLGAIGEDGQPVIPLDAHIRLAAPVHHGGARLLRRGYSYADGIDPVSGELDAGLIFLCYRRDPRRQFVPIQTALAAGDALNRYVQHTASAVFACPPGIDSSGHWGDHLLAGSGR